METKKMEPGVKQQAVPFDNLSTCTQSMPTIQAEKPSEFEMFWRTTFVELEPSPGKNEPFRALTFKLLLRWNRIINILLIISYGIDLIRDTKTAENTIKIDKVTHFAKLTEICPQWAEIDHWRQVPDFRFPPIGDVALTVREETLYAFCQTFILNRTQQMHQFISPNKHLFSISKSNFLMFKVQHYTVPGKNPEWQWKYVRV